jgi:FtsP/CotA-like multicopper oxidase with cupredoxin domain
MRVIGRKSLRPNISRHTVNLSRSDKDFGGTDESKDIAFAADNPVDWMRHCYANDHQESGMMGVIRVA